MPIDIVVWVTDPDEQEDQELSVEPSFFDLPHQEQFNKAARMLGVKEIFVEHMQVKDYNKPAWYQCASDVR